LERVAGTFCYAPQMLEKGGESEDPYDQFCTAIAFWVASFHLSSNQENPIEPLCGETFQAKIGGIPVYFEQTSPLEVNNLISFYMPGKNFTLSGTWNVSTTVYPNSVKGQFVGPSLIHYKNNGTKVYFQHPAGIVSGTGVGKRKFDYSGKFYAWDYENKFFAELIVDPPKDGGFFSKKQTTTDYIKGSVWVAKDSLFQKVKDSLAKKRYIDIKLNAKEDFEQEKDKIEGSWIDTFSVGDKVYWKFGAIKPHKMIGCKWVLPSDSNMRKEVLLRKIGECEVAEKIRDENKTRDQEDIKKRNPQQKKKLFGLFK